MTFAKLRATLQMSNTPDSARMMARSARTTRNRFSIICKSAVDVFSVRTQSLSAFAQSIQQLSIGAAAHLSNRDGCMSFETDSEPPPSDYDTTIATNRLHNATRSEERRVGKE